MVATREEVLARAGPCDHAAHLYVDDPSLIEAVALFAGSALERGEAVVLTATPEHLAAMTGALKRAGHDCAALHDSGQFVRVDAVGALERIRYGGQPSRAAFDDLVRPLIIRAKANFGGLAAYGELVNLLWQDGRGEDAHTLEQWWNELIAEYGFSLLCGYRIDPFDFQECVQDGIDTICCTHTHLLPVAEYERLERAVDEAMRQVFHNGDAASLRQHLLSRCERTTHMPPAQAALLALRDILPSLAQDVRMIARDYYRQSKAGRKAVATADI